MITLYAREGLRYIPVKEFSGFPADGVWMVKSFKGCVSSRLVTRCDVEKLCELPEPYLNTKLALEVRRDELIRIVDDSRLSSVNEVVTKIIETLSKEADKDV